MPICFDPVEIPGWGQIHCEYIVDAASLAEDDLAKGVDPATILSNLGGWLEEMVAGRTWRSEAAWDVLSRLRRLMLAGARVSATVSSAEEMACV
jgi:hypothetical protein